ncbi:lysine methyltransferase [Schizosaccharomyces japonicus yFS275]|uniref:Lysine methyltransferase n=1 Tax=Schizosaccharomyces japonicus (strain yFS275 / FY16936) TaxID=402676 RepID=B6K5A0_SCHJY|nr:lysine methyltransferase [Schizosaccharomyces japonicus yFS275]EEB08704.1 lysine methyltransferase [Schizosaccharomyces japonicus yFS275]
MLKTAQEMLQWAVEKNGYVVSPKISLKDYTDVNKSLGIGIVAVDNIKADETVVFFPKDSVMKVSGSYLQHLEGIEELPNWAALLLLMMNEKNNPESFWKPYISVFPTKERITSLFYWDAEKQKRLLKSTVLENMQDRSEVKTVWKETVLPFIDKNKSKLREGLTLEDFEHMAAVMSSYSFDVKRIKTENNDSQKASKQMDVDNSEHSENNEDDSDLESEYDPEVFEKAMCPIADMFNGDDELCNVRMYDLEDGYHMMVTRDIEKGEQLWNTYGDIDNGELLRKYGFTKPDGTTADYVLMKREQWAPQYIQKLGEEEFQRRLELLLEEDVITNLEGDFCFGRDSYNVTDACLTLVAMHKPTLSKVPKKSEIVPGTYDELVDLLDRCVKQYTVLENDESDFDAQNANVIVKNELRIWRLMRKHVRDLSQKKETQAKKKRMKLS